MRNRIFNQNARTALDQLKLEIANELDANITNAEATDGSMTSDLVKRAEKRMSEEDTYNPS